MKKGTTEGSSEGSLLAGSTVGSTSVAQMIALCLSLILELFSIQLTTIALEITREKKTNIRNTDIRNTDTDKKIKPHPFDTELSRRKLALLFNLLRTPIFDRATLPILQKVSQLLKYIPILNILPDYAVNMLSYLHNSHFRSSSSS
jgi:hypothetical protein